MLRIIADTIEYDNRPIATFLPGLGATLRYDAQLYIEGLTGWEDRERELEREHEKALDDMAEEHEKALALKDKEIERLLAFNERKVERLLALLNEKGTP